MVLDCSFRIFKRLLIQNTQKKRKMDGDDMFKLQSKYNPALFECILS